MEPSINEVDGEKSTITEPSINETDGEKSTITEPSINEADGEKSTITEPPINETDGEKSTIMEPSINEADGENTLANKSLQEVDVNYSDFEPNKPNNNSIVGDDEDDAESACFSDAEDDLGRPLPLRKENNVITTSAADNQNSEKQIGAATNSYDETSEKTKQINGNLYNCIENNSSVDYKKVSDSMEENWDESSVVEKPKNDVPEFIENVDDWDRNPATLAATPVLDAKFWNLYPPKRRELCTSIDNSDKNDFFNSREGPWQSRRCQRGRRSRGGRRGGRKSFDNNNWSSTTNIGQVENSWDTNTTNLDDNSTQRGSEHNADGFSRGFRQLRGRSDHVSFENNWNTINQVEENWDENPTQSSEPTANHNFEQFQTMSFSNNCNISNQTEENWDEDPAEKNCTPVENNRDENNAEKDCTHGEENCDKNLDRKNPTNTENNFGNPVTEYFTQIEKGEEELPTQAATPVSGDLIQTESKNCCLNNNTMEDETSAAQNSEPGEQYWDSYLAKGDFKSTDVNHYRGQGNTGGWGRGRGSRERRGRGRNWFARSRGRSCRESFARKYNSNRRGDYWGENRTNSFESTETTTRWNFTRPSVECKDSFDLTETSTNNNLTPLERKDGFGSTTNNWDHNIAPPVNNTSQSWKSKVINVPMEENWDETPDMINSTPVLTDDYCSTNILKAIHIPTTENWDETSFQVDAAQIQEDRNSNLSRTVGITNDENWDETPVQKLNITNEKSNVNNSEVIDLTMEGESNLNQITVELNRCPTRALKKRYDDGARIGQVSLPLINTEKYTQQLNSGEKGRSPVKQMKSLFPNTTWEFENNTSVKTAIVENVKPKQNLSPKNMTCSLTQCEILSPLRFFNRSQLKKLFIERASKRKDIFTQKYDELTNTADDFEQKIFDLCKETGAVYSVVYSYVFKSMANWRSDLLEKVLTKNFTNQDLINFSCPSANQTCPTTKRKMEMTHVEESKGTDKKVYKNAEEVSEENSEYLEAHSESPTRWQQTQVVQQNNIDISPMDKFRGCPQDRNSCQTACQDTTILNVNNADNDSANIRTSLYDKVPKMSFGCMLESQDHLNLSTYLKVNNEQKALTFKASGEADNIVTSNDGELLDNDTSSPESDHARHNSLVESQFSSSPSKKSSNLNDNNVNSDTSSVGNDLCSQMNVSTQTKTLRLNKRRKLRFKIIKGLRGMRRRARNRIRRTASKGNKDMIDALEKFFVDAWHLIRLNLEQT